ncbi:extracellular tyrosine-protein kinase PKDCC-like [Ornithodoros turicata]|uniref:extracellular tyrosine-protein kinase PKDCC-like n=1 Tax=Ornithodoros turicata TaxID=34597 RepID=UPI00313A1AD2
MLNESSKRFSSRRIRPVIIVILACCVVGNIMFIRSMRKDRANGALGNAQKSKASLYYSLLGKYFVLVGSEYRLKAMHDYEHFDCAAVASSVKRGDYIASGWTKSTYMGTYNGSIDVAVKVVNDGGHHIRECMEKDPKETLQECHMGAGAKVLNEILYHSWLNHPNIAKMYGYCIPKEYLLESSSKNLVVVTELGEPLDIIRLLQMSWEDRLRVGLGLARLLSYMSEDARGPILVTDFRRQQFVLHDGEIKLSDLDDVAYGDPACSAALDCEIVTGVQVQCVSGSCQNFAERSNVLKTGRHFLNFLLMPSVPQLLEHRVHQIMDAYQNASWSARKLLQETELVAKLFSNGSYRSPSKSYLTDYIRQNQSDLLGRFDYRCRMSMSSNICMLSVFDEEEAAETCSSDIACKAFVVTQQRSWSGRKIVYFKNGYSGSTFSHATTLYRRTG